LIVKLFFIPLILQFP